jgi:hypothetical protein
MYGAKLILTIGGMIPRRLLVSFAYIQARVARDASYHLDTMIGREAGNDNLAAWTESFTANILPLFAYEHRDFPCFSLL